MKNVLFVITLMVGSLSFAGQKDLKLQAILERANVSQDSAMSHTYTSINNVECKAQNGKVLKNFQCLAIDSNTSKNIKIKGKDAQALFVAIESVNGTEGAMGSIYTQSSDVTCVQVAKGVVEGSLAARTQCTIAK